MKNGRKERNEIRKKGRTREVKNKKHGKERRYRRYDNIRNKEERDGRWEEGWVEGIYGR
jgi:hypothetical protein